MKKFVIIPLLLLAASVGFLALKHRFEKQRATSVMLNARNMYMLLVSSEDIRLPPFHRFPQTTGSNAFETSTDYFRNIVTSDYPQLSFNFFAAPGIKAADSAETFTSDNNAWCIVADIPRNAPANTPVLITRNIAINSLDQTPQWDDDSPLDLKYAAIISLAGSGVTVSKDSVRELFTHLGMSNRVLRP